MNKNFSKQKSLLTAIFLTTCLLILTSSCASGVPQEEYDQLESQLAQVTTELNQTKEELAAAQEEAAAAQKALQDPLQPVQALWESFEPLVEIGLLRFENQRDYNLRELGEITHSDYRSRALAIWVKITGCLTEIGSEELTEKLTKAWYEPWGGDNDRLWREYNDLYLSLTEDALQELSQKLGH